MKQKIISNLWSAIILSLLFFICSCKKNVQDVNSEMQQSGLSIVEAKAWYLSLNNKKNLV